MESVGLFSFKRWDTRKLPGKQPALEVDMVDPGSSRSCLEAPPVPPVIPSRRAEPLSALAPLQASCSPSPSSGRGWPSCWALPCCVFTSTLTKSPEVSERDLAEPPITLRTASLLLSQQWSSPSLGIPTPKGWGCNHFHHLWMLWVPSMLAWTAHTHWSFPPNSWSHTHLRG